MEKKVKRIGVLTSGGDAPGMNAAVRAVVRAASNQGIGCIGIRRGWNGLINSDFIPMKSSTVSHIINKGGTLLYTARSAEFMEPAGREKALNTCRLLGLDGIVAIGGDGTFRGALAALIIPSALTPPAIPPLNVSISSGIPCSPMNAAPSWKSWAGTRGIWPFMSASPWALPLC